jgi:hypothetical protein
VPLVGVTDSHGESLDAVNVSVPPPTLETFAGACGGLELLPCVPWKAKLVWETDSEGGLGGGAPPPPHPLKTTLMIASKKKYLKRFIIASCRSACGDKIHDKSTR